MLYKEYGRGLILFFQSVRVLHRDKHLDLITFPAVLEDRAQLIHLLGRRTAKELTLHLQAQRKTKNK